ncbi:cardiolipin synthase [Allorhodopirellula solitaria]|uniref:cardiolipin synthase n=1 Tax=Allorhodopirellula solitaria TaxID=2527987 RepID=UPI0011B4777C|nr:cardiolipin synthase [Allorhodopirellula solitaria]
MTLFSIESVAHWWGILVPLTLLFLHAVAVVSAWHAIRNTRTSQAAVAWTVALLALPAFTLPAYWVFARSRFAGYREAVRDVGRQHLASLNAIEQETMTRTDARTTALISPLDQVADVLDTPICEGNHFELLIDGEAFVSSLMDQIATAEHYVYAEFYIIRDDAMGKRFADALIAQAEAGRTVRLLYDEVGCLKLPSSYLSRLRGAGVDVRAFNTRQGWVNRFQLNFRNHRKLLVIDGQRGVVGGLNIGDEYLGNHGWVERWRDTAVAVRGPIVKKIQAVFASDYYWASRTGLSEAQWAHEPATDSLEAGDSAEDSVEDSAEATGLAAICATGPADPRARATMMFAAAAGAARDRLWISTPYLVPDETTLNSLSMACARGVDVRILVPSDADQWLVYLAGFHFESELKSLGVAVYRYTGGFLHQKCVLVDNDLAMIGSTNLDNRSLHLNFEMMLAMDHSGLVAEVAEMLDQDFAAATKSGVTPQRLRPWYGRIGTIVARLFSPIL